MAQLATTTIYGDLIVQRDIYLSGNVGIGTTNPAYKLDVAGDIRFTGTLQGGTVPWARLSGVPTASTSQAGIVQLNNTVTSTSTTQAATANAVKQAYDLAASKVSKSGDTMTGTLTIHNYALISAPSGLIAGNDAVFETIQGGVRSQIRAQDGNSVNEAGLRVRVSGDSGSTWTDVLQVTPSTFTYGTNKVWHAGNDGSGSGLDADLLDGQDSSYYRNASNLNAGNLNIARMPTGGNWSLSSNLTIDTSTLAIDITNDRVGIGTTSPSAKLHVSGTARVDGVLNQNASSNGRLVLPVGPNKWATT